MPGAGSRGRGLVALVAVMTLLVACGDDDDDGDGVGEPGGEPIRIASWTSIENPSFSQPQARTAAQAKVKAINDAGGIGGRQVELEFCDTRLDPNQEAACARQAVERGVVAVVGASTVFPNTLPLLEQAGIAYVGGQGASADELSSEVSFPLAGGVPAWFQGAAALALERGVQRPAIVDSPLGAAKFSSQQAEAGLRAGGVPPVRVVSAPVGLPDQAASAAEAAEGTDGIIIATVAVDAVKILQSLRQANYSGVITSVTAVFTADAIDSVGQAANGLLLAGQLTPVSKTDNPAVSQFVEDMDAQDPGAAKDEIALRVWAAIGLFADVVENIDGEATARSVLDAMTGLADPIDVGVTAPYAVQGRVSPVADFPRIFNPTIVYNEVRDQQVVQTSDGFVNPFEELAGR